jgi:hypothetical protein
VHNTATTLGDQDLFCTWAVNSSSFHPKDPYLYFEGGHGVKLMAYRQKCDLRVDWVGLNGGTTIWHNVNFLPNVPDFFQFSCGIFYVHIFGVVQECRTKIIILHSWLPCLDISFHILWGTRYLKCFCTYTQAKTWIITGLFGFEYPSRHQHVMCLVIYRHTKKMQDI